ncbi:MAG: CRISPR-associated helicase Cas3' [Clostridia bacterium]|nr:CRISPR-associated helicase Cas3' [Clostridia bacterium]
MYIAHKSSDGREQPLCDHLKGVGRRAGEYAAAFGAAEHAERTGVLHDIGKYSPAGQRRMRDPEHTSKVDHSTAGAIVAAKMKDMIAALTIAGHHGGLMDVGGLPSDGDGTLMTRLKKPLTGDLDYTAWQTEISVNNVSLTPAWLSPRDAFGIQFYTRMLFSCLVDADFIDTETFMQGAPASRGGDMDMQTLWEKLQAHVKPWLETQGDDINGRRSEILRDCVAAGEMAPGLFTLTVPTGGGKTVSSLAFALAHAARHNLRRVIYVIPYTSIIEQNAKVFSDILGPENVLEHHSGVEFDEGKDAEDPQVMRKMLAMENWDAPVVVTTAVQFFESLFAAKTARCRKLHNIADSVIIFDEAQMLPIPYLEPCVAAIAELVKHYRVTAVLCTATQPSLNGLFRQYAPELPPREICRSADELTACFRRVRYAMEGTLNRETLAEKLLEQRQALCIVNLRKTAREVFHLLPEEGRFHLSTYMTPEDRARVLEDIRQRLKDGKICRVVSTSLIEAGVDVDFPTVWRELAGLDSIIQAAGRCNREGRRDPADSLVHVFSLEEGVPRMIRQNAAATDIAIDGQENIDAAPVIRRYFDTLLRLKDKQALDVKDIMDLCRMLALRSVAEAFHIIEQDTVPIYIPTDGNAEDIARLRRGEVSRALLRRLNRSAVSVYRHEWRALCEAGKLEDAAGEYGILADRSAYDEECGLNTTVESGNALWL